MIREFELPIKILDKSGKSKVVWSDICFVVRVFPYLPDRQQTVVKVLSQ